ncbi:hypothetical protein BCR39DRAFT_504111 [Naematelia encephala]|uniref:Uncharacterized protein n=1 Tax=Naematelia encephala TaxID=71784 RepID=A0A1Y2BEM1_9TREE|nr:hypothetical protein BCR39DRAFT_504111 [Naematelia encephala]
MDSTNTNGRPGRVSSDGNNEPIAGWQDEMTVATSDGSLAPESRGRDEHSTGIGRDTTGEIDATGSNIQSAFNFATGERHFRWWTRTESSGQIGEVPVIHDTSDSWYVAPGNPVRMYHTKITFTGFPAMISMVDGTIFDETIVDRTDTQWFVFPSLDNQPSLFIAFTRKHPPVTHIRTLTTRTEATDTQMTDTQPRPATDSDATSNSRDS